MTYKGIGEYRAITLTTGIDILGGTAGNDTFVATDATYTTGDDLTGGSGNDILNLVLTAENTALVDLHGIETVNIRNTNNATAVEAIGWADVTAINYDRGTEDVTVNNVAANAAVGVTAGVGANSDFTVNFVNDVVKGDNDSAIVNLTNANANVITLGDVDGTDGFENLTINVSGNSTIDTIQTSSSDGLLENVTIAGTGNLTMATLDNNDGYNDGYIKSITSTLNGNLKVTGGIDLKDVATISLGAGNDDLADVEVGAEGVAAETAVSATIDLGAGNDKIYVNGLADGNVVTINGGAGNDTIRVDDLTNKLTINGGDGTDTLRVTSAVANGIDAATVISGMEVLAITDALANNITMSKFGGTTRLSLEVGAAAAGTVTMANGGTIAFDQLADVTGNVTSGTVVANVTGASAAGANSDVVNIEVNADFDGRGAHVFDATVGVAFVETVNIKTTDTDTTTAGGGESVLVELQSGDRVSTITVDAKVATTVAEDGTNFTALNVVNASSSTAGVTIDVSNASQGVVITGGSGKDVFTGSAYADNISGGAGNDIITGGAGADIINVGTGRDVVNVSSNSDADVALSSSTTTGADAITGFGLSGVISTAADLATIAKFQAATAGGANVSLLNIDLTKDDAVADTTGVNLALAVEGNGTGAAQMAGATYTVANGILTLSGVGAANVDTLTEWLAEVAAVAATDGDALAFQFGGDTYVFAQNGAQDALVQLVGVTGAAALTLVGGATTTVANSILISDSF